MRRSRERKKNDDERNRMNRNNSINPMKPKTKNQNEIVHAGSVSFNVIHARIF